jgi:hypothetical protein
VVRFGGSSCFFPLPLGQGRGEGSTARTRFGGGNVSAACFFLSTCDTIRRQEPGFGMGRRGSQMRVHQPTDVDIATSAAILISALAPRLTRRKASGGVICLWRHKM